MTIAIGVVAVALAYPLWMLLAGPQHYAGPIQLFSNSYYNDLLSFVIPGPLQRVSFGLPSHWGGELNTNPFIHIEAVGYIGIPLLLVTAGLAWRSRHRARMQLTVVLLAVSGVLSLGPSLYVAGKATHIPLPFVVFKHLPVVNDILPSRISFATSAFLAAAIGFGLDDWHLRQPRTRCGPGLGGRPRMSAAHLLAAVTLVALVVSQLPSWPYEAPSTSALPVGVEQAIPLRDPVSLTYPYPPLLSPLLWQAADDYRFSILGGYARHSNTKGSGALSQSPIPMNPPELQQFLLAYDDLAEFRAESVGLHSRCSDHPQTAEGYANGPVAIPGAGGARGSDLGRGAFGIEAVPCCAWPSEPQTGLVLHLGARAANAEALSHLSSGCRTRCITVNHRLPGGVWNRRIRAG